MTRVATCVLNFRLETQRDTEILSIFKEILRQFLCRVFALSFLFPEVTPEIQNTDKDIQILALFIFPV